MMEQAEAGEDHGDFKGVAGVNDVLVRMEPPGWAMGDAAAACLLVVSSGKAVACQEAPVTFSSPFSSTVRAGPSVNKFAAILR